ncbi:uncharacterized protein LOC141606633 [Silene latifolia]|uniref:uncharacterized protein LOC141606633 n=1 Tax=Silene latifolia TaxID=37657 RepID=UPI003D784082
MGREWYFIWGSKSSNKKAGGIKGNGGGSGRGGGREKKSVRPQVTAATVASGGCMNALLHLFNFHHFHVCLHSQNSSYLPDDDLTPSKGVEAPRNSLSNIEDEKQFYLNIPVDIQIKTNRRDTRLKLESKTKEMLETIDSPAPGARTPTIVARLMGLDVLPESNTSTPRSSSSYSRVSTRSPPNRTTKAQRKRSVKNDLQSVLGRSSLPESPKSSTSSQRRMSLSSTNVVDKHRLSLQINKENNIVKEMESSRRSCSAINAKKRVGRRYEDENNNNSPGFYAKQIMKQVKETVSNRRSFGADITNKIGQSEFRKDDNLLLEKQPIKPNKSRLVKSSDITKKTKFSRCDVREIVPTIDKLEVKNNERDNCCTKFDNADNNGIKSCLKMSTKSCEYVRNKKDDELFVRPSTRARGNNLGTEKKCKKTPLTKELVDHSTVPSIIPLKKDSSYLQVSPKKLLEKQGSSKAQITKLYNTSSTTTTTNNNTVKQLSRKPGRRTNATIQQQEAAYNPVDHEKTTRTNKNSSIAEFQYISKILKCTGINYSDTSISLTKWFSPLHPLDPTIYHNLEASCYFTSVNIDHLPSDINRKLIFHLVDEILADILLKPNNMQINGLELVKILCRRIRSFTSIDCKTLQDIDALVEQDMPRFGEDGEAIVAEIERDIFDSLVQEIVVF